MKQEIEVTNNKNESYIISIENDGTDTVIDCDHFNVVIPNDNGCNDPNITFNSTVETIRNMVQDNPYFDAADDMAGFWTWYTDMETAYPDDADMFNVLSEYDFPVMDEMEMAA